MDSYSLQIELVKKDGTTANATITGPHDSDKLASFSNAFDVAVEQLSENPTDPSEVRVKLVLKEK